MAPITGGGPPIGSAGGAFTGAAQALEIIGDHCYAYSGVADLDSNATSYISFRSGTGLVVGQLQIFTDWEGIADNAITIQVFLNEIPVIFERRASAGGQNYTGDEITYNLIIPPLTLVEVKLHSPVAEEASAILTGRIYR